MNNQSTGDNKKIVLIDGHSILNRAFYGIPDLTNSSGLHTNAVYGFLNIMFKIIDEENPTNLVVAFDVKQKTFRHKMFAEYKGTRKPMPDELREQVPLIKEVLQSMNISIAQLPGYEADDVLGTLARRAESAHMQVRVITGDRDLLQLATKNIQIRIPKTKRGSTEIENYFEDDVFEKYQVTPSEFIDVKALMGDTADNIPGVPSIGEKTATNLITTYKSVENIYEHLEEITKKRTKEALTEYKDQAFMSKELATIETNSPVDIDLNETGIENMFTKEAFEWMNKLEFKSILSKFDVKDKKDFFEVKYSVITDFTQIQDIMKKALETNEIGINVAADRIQECDYDIVAFTIAFSKNEIYIMPKQWFMTDEYISDMLKKLLIQPQTNVSLIDLKKHLKLISDDTFDSETVFDNEIAAYLLNPLKDTYQYDDLARDYLSETVLSKNELIGKQTYRKAYEDNKEKFNMCVALEAIIVLLTKPILQNELEQTSQLTLFQNIEMPLIFSLNRMENVGVKVEKDELSRYASVLSDKISIIEQEIYKEVGMEFNINSPKQLGEVLFEKLEIKGGKKTKTGYSTAADVLEKLAPKYPVVSKVLEYRQLTKLKSTYADGLQNYIAKDGRIHSTFNQTITATGRISSTEPNLQNIPIRMELGKAIRKVFVAKEGYHFIDADYSQIELRILADCSGDETLIEAYNSAQDIHAITASKVFHVPLDEVTKELRSNAKAVNFGIVYGISSFGLSQDLSITKKEASEYIKQYFETYKGIKQFLDKSVEDAKENGYVTTKFGRRRPVLELKSSNFMQRSFGERIAMNSPIQGTAADIMKIAMINVDRALRLENLKSRIVLQVHDELLVETLDCETERVKEILRYNMQNAADLKVALEVGIDEGNNWLDAH